MKTILFLVLLLLLLLPAAAPAEGDFEFGDSVPAEALREKTENGGRVEAVTYMSRDYYAGNGAEVEKHALVYLPAGYSEEEPCDVLVLCHGVGGTEYEWGFTDPSNGSLNLVDSLFAQGTVKNLIIVMPNGRSCANYADVSFGNMYAFYSFGQEIRNDLLPFIDAHYNTWASKTPDDPAQQRLHRAMAGLSMGGMQTVNIGMCECLDLFSAFGAFSAAPTSYTAKQIAEKLKAFPESMGIRYFYSVCGKQDTVAYAAAAAAGKTKPEDARLTEENWTWQEVPGVHDFRIWHLGLYNFLRLLGSLQE